MGALQLPSFLQYSDGTFSDRKTMGCTGNAINEDCQSARELHVHSLLLAYRLVFLQKKRTNKGTESFYTLLTNSSKYLTQPFSYFLAVCSVRVLIRLPS